MICSVVAVAVAVVAVAVVVVMRTSVAAVHRLFLLVAVCWFRFFAFPARAHHRTGTHFSWEVDCLFLPRFLICGWSQRGQKGRRTTKYLY